MHDHEPQDPGSAAPRLPTTLEEWRLYWPELSWRSGWEAHTDQRRAERELQKIKRRRRDRRYIGQELWGVAADKVRARTDADRLQRLDLPLITTESELADWFGITLERLRWFTHDKRIDHTYHYVRYEVAKRRGGTRVILAPKTELKAMQRKLYAELLAKVPTHSAAHGFVPARSTLTNAAPHTGRGFVLNMDLRDFFPSITYRRVRGVFIALGYSLGVASVLALICTERERRRITRRGEPVFVSVGERTLVQGAPTSPAIANLVARKLDARLAGLARKINLTYTRYADDLTFSGDDLGSLLDVRRLASEIIAAEGFGVHPEKTRIYRASGRQVVTGLVVNARVATPRELRRRVRAILHAARYTGLEAQNRHNVPDFRAYLLGLIGYIHAANPAHAEPLYAQLSTLPD